MAVKRGWEKSMLVEGWSERFIVPIFLLAGWR